MCFSSVPCTIVEQTTQFILPLFTATFNVLAAFILRSILPLTRILTHHTIDSTENFSLGPLRFASRFSWMESHEKVL